MKTFRKKIKINKRMYRLKTNSCKKKKNEKQYGGFFSQKIKRFFSHKCLNSKNMILYTNHKKYKNYIMHHSCREYGLLLLTFRLIYQCFWRGFGFLHHFVSKKMTQQICRFLNKVYVPCKKMINNSHTENNKSKIEILAKKIVFFIFTIEDYKQRKKIKNLILHDVYIFIENKTYIETMKNKIDNFFYDFEDNIVKKNEEFKLNQIQYSLIKNNEINVDLLKNIMNVDNDININITSTNQIQNLTKINPNPSNPEVKPIIVNSNELQYQDNIEDSYLVKYENIIKNFGLTCEQFLNNYIKIKKYEESDLCYNIMKAIAEEKIEEWLSWDKEEEQNLPRIFIIGHNFWHPKNELQQRYQNDNCVTLYSDLLDDNADSYLSKEQKLVCLKHYLKNTIKRNGTIYLSYTEIIIMNRKLNSRLMDKFTCIIFDSSVEANIFSTLQGRLRTLILVFFLKDIGNLYLKCPLNQNISHISNQDIQHLQQINLLFDPNYFDQYGILKSLQEIPLMSLMKSNNSKEELVQIYSNLLKRIFEKISNIFNNKFIYDEKLNDDNFFYFNMIPYHKIQCLPNEIPKIGTSIDLILEIKGVLKHSILFQAFINNMLPDQNDIKINILAYSKENKNINEINEEIKNCLIQIKEFQNLRLNYDITIIHDTENSSNILRKLFDVIIIGKDLLENDISEFLNNLLRKRGFIFFLKDINVNMSDQKIFFENKNIMETNKKDIFIKL